MPGRLAHFKRRLRKLEQQAKAKELSDTLANCNSIPSMPGLLLSSGPGAAKHFEAEVNLPCPAHGLRRLGQIRVIVFVKPDRTTDEDPELDPLLQKYSARIAEDDRRLQREEQQKQDDYEDEGF